jgi:hypothetical protein
MPNVADSASATHQRHQHWCSSRYDPTSRDRLARKCSPGIGVALCLFQPYRGRQAVMALRRRIEDAELIAFGVGDHGPVFFGCDECRASTDEVFNVPVDVDVHSVLSLLGLGYPVEPKGGTGFVDRIDGDGRVSFGSDDAYYAQRGEIFRSVRSNSIPKNFGPPVTK